MAWYDLGLNGAKAMPSSPINQPALSYGYSKYNSPGPGIIATYSLNANKDVGDTYTVLLNTFSTGTQLYMQLSVSEISYDYINPMAPYVSKVRQHGGQMYLKKGDSLVNLTGSNVGNRFFSSMGFASKTPADALYSLYWCEYIFSNGALTAASMAPFYGAGAGLNVAIIGNVDSTGYNFYRAELASQSGPYTDQDIYVNFECPLTWIGRIPVSYLNDPGWFDPELDAFTPTSDTGTGFGVGGNIPDLPVSPSYPGSNMSFPDLPTGASALGFGRLTLFKPSATNLANALDILYSDSDESTLETIIESCKKWWYKPEQYCVSLMISPVNATASQSKSVKFGKYDSEEVTPYVSDQWQITDCGTINIPLKFGSFLDFEPLAKLKIYLPFIGLRSLNANECIGGTLSIKYYTDMLTGVSVCMVLVSRTGSNNTILYTFDCNVGMQIPLTSENYSNVISNLLSAGVAAGVSAATFGVGAIGAAAAQAGAIGAAGSAANALSGMGSPDLTQSGNLSANSGMLCYKKPYVCIQMPVPTTPANFSSEKGRPSNIYMNLGSCSGYTVISNLHADISGASDKEITMIKDAFRKGVYM